MIDAVEMDPRDLALASAKAELSRHKAGLRQALEEVDRRGKVAEHFRRECDGMARMLAVLVHRHGGKAKVDDAEVSADQDLWLEIERKEDHANLRGYRGESARERKALAMDARAQEEARQAEVRRSVEEASAQARAIAEANGSPAEVAVDVRGPQRAVRERIVLGGPKASGEG